jgi:hypothetical protein
MQKTSVLFFWGISLYTHLIQPFDASSQAALANIKRSHLLQQIDIKALETVSQIAALNGQARWPSS